MKKDALKLPDPPKSAEALLDEAALMLFEELQMCHALIREINARGDIGFADLTIKSVAALAGALAKLKGETRQRITVERPEGEGGRVEKSKNE